MDYLEQHGWQAVDGDNDRILMFEKGTYDDGSPIQVVVPSSKHYVDYIRGLADAITFLTDLEERSVESIFEEICGGYHR